MTTYQPRRSYTLTEKGEVAVTLYGLLDKLAKIERDTRKQGQTEVADRVQRAIDECFQVRPSQVRHGN